MTTEQKQGKNLSRRGILARVVKTGELAPGEVVTLYKERKGLGSSYAMRYNHSQ